MMINGYGSNFSWVMGMGEQVEVTQIFEKPFLLGKFVLIETIIRPRRPWH